MNICLGTGKEPVLFHKYLFVDYLACFWTFLKELVSVTINNFILRSRDKKGNQRCNSSMP